MPASDHGMLLRPKRQSRVRFDFFQDDVRANLGYPGQLKYEVVQKFVVGINIFNDDP